MIRLALFIAMLSFSPLLSANAPAITYNGAGLALGNGCALTLSPAGAVRIVCQPVGDATLKPRSRT